LKGWCLVSFKKDPGKPINPPSGFSRRGFLKGVGVGGGALGAGVLENEANAQSSATYGPGAVPITLTINGRAHKLEVEPRVTLLNAIRERLEYTGSKRVCDRGTCGACTVMIEGKAVYACSVLAIDVQGRDIQTIEGLAADNDLTPMMEAFVDNDGLQCGFCTPGFVVAATAFVKEHPHPSMDDVKEGLGGNLCRCGTYMGIRQAVLDAAREMGGRNA
jgi:xanthine dehydrogenase YagT iron-sulfur-binding subunit